MNARVSGRNRQKTAQKLPLRKLRLDSAFESATVEVVSGVFIPASLADYLFRTPSLNGRAFVSYDSPSVSFWSKRSTSHRRGSAHRGRSNPFLLRALRFRDQCPAQATRPQEGRALCEQHRFGRHCPYAQALPPAVIQPANRRSMARARGSLARRCWTPTSMPVQPPAQLPTCCIATRIRASATDLTGSQPRERATRLPAAIAAAGAIRRFQISRHAASGPRASGGVLRSTSTQTKDIPCSPRS